MKHPAFLLIITSVSGSKKIDSELEGTKICGPNSIPAIKLSTVVNS